MTTGLFNRENACKILRWEPHNVHRKANGLLDWMRVGVAKK